MQEHDKSQQDPLTPREWQVFELLRRGFDDYRIAQVLGITEPEAARHVASILSKLGASSRRELAWKPLPDERKPPPQPGRRSFPRKLIIGGAVTLLVIIIAVAGLILIADDDSTVTAPNGDTDGPVIGDHWHAALQVTVCGETLEPIDTFPGGVHTHDDGFIHLHPQQPFEENEGATLAMFFEYGGGLLTSDTLRMPNAAETYRNGDTCPDGGEGVLRVTVNGFPHSDFPDYIPRDGDIIEINFGPAAFNG